MRPADSWRDYELLDATNHNRLERWGQTLLIRPDPQVIWKNDETSPLWAKADAVYYRSAKGMVNWARENAKSSGLEGAPIRWIVDDCAKFVQREIRRGSRYDAVIMDPPSYGRGPGGEIWKLEDNVYDLITLTEQVLSDDPLFFAINSYTEGLSPAVMEYIVKTTLCPVKGGHTHCDEIGLPVSATGGVVPCGATAIWEK